VLHGGTYQEKVNTYKLEAIMPEFLNDYPPYVTFTTPDQEKLPVPSPTYLAIHAACAKVTLFSGAGKFVDDFNRHMEGSLTLAPDGSSAPLLQQAIEVKFGTSPA